MACGLLCPFDVAQTFERRYQKLLQLTDAGNWGRYSVVVVDTV